MIPKTQNATTTLADVNSRAALQAGEDRAAQKKKDLQAAQQVQSQVTKSREAQTGMVNVVG
jgi:hypothetical protein